jgi:hypothetical protein
VKCPVFPIDEMDELIPALCADPGVLAWRRGMALLELPSAAFRGRNPPAGELMPPAFSATSAARKFFGFPLSR